MQGSTLSLWESLASLGAVDLTVARVTEPHLDALAILREARRDHQIRDEDWQRCSPDWSAAGLWQVYAAEGAERLHAVEADGRWTLDGIKPWCSLADHATHALITAWLDDEHRGLFAIDLSDDGVSAAEGRSGQSAGLGLPRAGGGPQHLARLPVGAGGPGLPSRSGTSAVRASPGAASASRRSGTAPPSRSRGPCATRQPVVRRTRSPWFTSERSTPRWPEPAPSWSGRRGGRRPRPPPTRPSWWPSGPARSSLTPPTR